MDFRGICMSWKLRAVCVALGWLLCASVSAKPPKLEARFLGDDTLLLDFPEPMRNWDNATRSDLVRIAPQLSTTCSWDSDTRLNCRLGAKIANATRYRIDVAAGLLTQTGRALGARTV